MDTRRILGRVLMGAAGIGAVITGIVLGSPRQGDTAALIGLLVCFMVFFVASRVADARHSSRSSTRRIPK